MEKRIVATAVMCCAFALALGLVACGGSSSSSAASSASGASSEAASSASASGASASAASSAAQTIEVPAEYIDIDGGITLDAVMGLTGPELATLLKQQGYAWDILGWKNADTENFARVRDAEGKSIKEADFAAATGKGELANGYVQIVSHAREIIYTDDLVTVRDAMLHGFTVQDSWLTGGGAYLYNVVENAEGARYILIVVAEDQNEAIIELQSDAYLVANGDGGVDGIIELWKS